MVLLFLAVIWAAVLVPPLLRARAEANPADSIGNFRRQLHILQRTSPGLGLAPANSLRFLPTAGPVRPTPSVRRTRTLKRRRDVLFGLLGAMGGSLLLGLLPSLRVLWGLHLVLDALFAGYVVLLVRMRNLSAEREMKLRFIPTAAAPEPALLLRRSAH